MRTSKLADGLREIMPSVCSCGSDMFNVSFVSPKHKTPVSIGLDEDGVWIVPSEVTVECYEKLKPVCVCAECGEKNVLKKWSMC